MSDTAVNSSTQVDPFQNALRVTSSTIGFRPCPYPDFLRETSIRFYPNFGFYPVTILRNMRILDPNAAISHWRIGYGTPFDPGTSSSGLDTKIYESEARDNLRSAYDDVYANVEALFDATFSRPVSRKTLYKLVPAVFFFGDSWLRDAAVTSAIEGIINQAPVPGVNLRSLIRQKLNDLNPSYNPLSFLPMLTANDFAPSLVTEFYSR